MSSEKSDEYRGYDVVIPYYNGQETIKRAIRSVMGQSLQPRRIIIIDDGSSSVHKNSLSKLKYEHGELLRIYETPNRGQSLARNFGVDMSESPIVLFLDQDDFWKSNHALTLVSALSSQKGLVYSDIDLMFENNGKEYVVPRYSALASIQPKKSLYSWFGQNLHVLPSALGAHVDSFRELGGFDGELRGFEDDDLILRAHAMGVPIHYTSESTAFWSVTKDSASYGLRMIRSRSLHFRRELSRANSLKRSLRPLAKVMVLCKFLVHAPEDVLEIRRSTKCSFAVAVQQWSRLENVGYISAFNLFAQAVAPILYFGAILTRGARRFRSVRRILGATELTTLKLSE